MLGDAAFRDAGQRAPERRSDLWSNCRSHRTYWRTHVRIRGSGAEQRAAAADGERAGCARVAEGARFVTRAVLRNRILSLAIALLAILRPTPCPALFPRPASCEICRRHCRRPPQHRSGEYRPVSSFIHERILRQSKEASAPPTPGAPTPSPPAAAAPSPSATPSAAPPTASAPPQPRLLLRQVQSLLSRRPRQLPHLHRLPPQVDRLQRRVATRGVTRRQSRQRTVAQGERIAALVAPRHSKTIARALPRTSYQNGIRRKSHVAGPCIHGVGGCAWGGRQY